VNDENTLFPHVPVDETSFKENIDEKVSGSGSSQESATTIYNVNLEDTQGIPRQASGTAAWLQCVQVVLSEEESISYLRDALRAEIESKPIEVLRTIVLPIEKLRLQHEKNNALNRLGASFEYDTTSLEQSVPEVTEPQSIIEVDIEDNSVS
jgi:hypothetical protein